MHLSAVISHLKRAFYTGNEQYSQFIVLLFILKGISLSTELLSVAPWLWGCDRVSEKMCSITFEVSWGGNQGTEERRLT